MAYAVARTQKDVDKIVKIITDAHGFVPDVFKDGRLYRVQHNDIGSDALRELLTNAGIKTDVY